MAKPNAVQDAPHNALVDLAEAAHAVDTRSYEARDVASCRRELVPRVDDLLARAIELAQSFADNFVDVAASPADTTAHRESLRPAAVPSGDDAPGAARTSTHFHAQIDALVRDASRGPALVGDIAFIATLELREKRQRLARATSRESADQWDVIEACASARRRIIKSVTALELVSSEVQGRRPSLDYRTELAVALEVRRRYATLRATIAPGDPPDEQALLARLRVIGTRIAMVVGLDVYPDLRLRDRVVMRALQARILQWLAGDQNAREGTRLWCDLVGFADLIAQVRRRQELIEYDAGLAKRLLGQISALQPQDSFDANQLDLLRSLRGASDEIDALLDEGEQRVGTWTAPLNALSSGPDDGSRGGDGPPTSHPDMWGNSGSDSVGSRG